MLSSQHILRGYLKDLGELGHQVAGYDSQSIFTQINVYYLCIYNSDRVYTGW
jgi:hypothetical protein